MIYDLYFPTQPAGWPVSEQNKQSKAKQASEQILSSGSGRRRLSPGQKTTDDGGMCLMVYVHTK